MAKRTVVIDLFNYQLPIPGTTPTRYSHHRAYRGETLDFPAAVVKRGDELGALADPDDAVEVMAAIDGESGPLPATAEGDAELATWAADGLIAYVTQNPGESARVYALEQKRSGKIRPRKTVIRAAGFDPDTGEAIEPPASLDDTPPPGTDPTAATPATVTG